MPLAGPTFDAAALMPKPIESFIGLGANLDQPIETVRRAIGAIGQLAGTRLIAQSSLFRTAPVEADGDDYVNAVVQIATALSASDLLRALQEIEQDFGRARPYFHAPRSLDLDLLLYGDLQIDSATLQVPHPRMSTRAFVLIPLLQIDPLINIPGHGLAHQLVARVSDQVIKKIN